MLAICCYLQKQKDLRRWIWESFRLQNDAHRRSVPLVSTCVFHLKEPQHQHLCAIVHSDPVWGGATGHASCSVTSFSYPPTSNHREVRPGGSHRVPHQDRLYLASSDSGVRCRLFVQKHFWKILFDKMQNPPIFQLDVIKYLILF